MSLDKIISGGQTGVDRGALDAALSAGFPCGGSCPAGRKAEDGSIAHRYPLAPLARGGYRERTRQNVLDSDGTVILVHGRLTGGRLTGGTQLTRTCCLQVRKPLLTIDATNFTAVEAAAAIMHFIGAHGIRVLNIAGPRASSWPEAHGFAFEVITRVLRQSTRADKP